MVCVIGDHWLGAAYLTKVLTTDSSIEPLTLPDVVGRPDLQQKPLVFVIDYRGLQVPFSQCLIALRRKFPNARYLVVGQEGTQEDITRTVLLGIDGFIAYPKVTDMLVRAVHAIATGELWFDSYTVKKLLEAKTRSTGRNSVTFRESQVLDLAKQRLTNKEIGSALGIQESTVKYHLTNIFTKLGVDTRDDLLDNPDPTGCWKKLLAT
jgi:DNA-binding NarL/FixJ family response regulator